MFKKRKDRVNGLTITEFMKEQESKIKDDKKIRKDISNKKKQVLKK